VGEYHKSLEILSPREGILRATAYGAVKGKSRLAGVSEPFTEGNMYLYHDPVKDRITLTEVDAQNSHEGLRSDLTRYYIASFWVEFVIKSFAGGGEFASLYRLLKGALDALEHAYSFDAIVIHFVWRYLDLIGFRPDLSACEECGAPAGERDSLYLEGTSFVCRRCSALEEDELTPWGRSLLARSMREPFAEIEKSLSIREGAAGGEQAGSEQTGARSSARELKRVKSAVLGLVENVVERPLNTLTQGFV
jgi:DNA repair protein RecO (recombination protein O)